MNETTETPKGVDLADGQPTEETEAPREDAGSAGEAAEVTSEAQTESGTESADTQQEEQESGEPELSPLEQAQKESAEYKDAWQRERADFANYRKRMIHEKAQLREGAIGSVVHDLLEPLDNLDRVLTAKSDHAELASFVEGVEMIRSQFLGVLEKYNVKAITPDGEPFDPFSMEAIATEEREDLEQERVLEVYQVGYLQELSGGPHVLRPARVKVGRPSQAKAASAEAGGEKTEQEE